MQSFLRSGIQLTFWQDKYVKSLRNSLLCILEHLFERGMFVLIGIATAIVGHVNADKAGHGEKDLANGIGVKAFPVYFFDWSSILST